MARRATGKKRLCCPAGDDAKRMIQPTRHMATMRIESQPKQLECARLNRRERDLGSAEEAMAPISAPSQTATCQAAESYPV